MILVDSLITHQKIVRPLNLNSSVSPSEGPVGLFPGTWAVVPERPWRRVFDR